MTDPIEANNESTTLGHAESYTAVVHAQGGQQVFALVQGATEITWGRKLDDYSEASITVAKKEAGAACCEKLGDVHTWGHELSIYRDDEFVWQGPIVQKTESASSFTFEARDVFAYLDRRPIWGIYNWAYKDTEETQDAWNAADSAVIAGNVLRDSLGRPGPHGLFNDRRMDPNLWDHAYVAAGSGVAATFQQFIVGENVSGDVLRELTEYGLDVYATARRISIVPTVWKRQWRPLRLSEHDFLADLEIRENGMDAATLAVVIGTQQQNPIQPSGNPNKPDTQVPSDRAKPGGAWPWFNTNTNQWVPRSPFDPFYGYIGMTGSSSTATRNIDCQRIAQEIVQYGLPAPIDIVTPDGAQLAPTCPVGIQQIVPGYPVIVALDSYCSPVRQQRMQFNELEVSVDLSGSGMSEAVKVSLASGPTPLDAYQ